jgi:hypothetical protein
VKFSIVSLLGIFTFVSISSTEGKPGGSEQGNLGILFIILDEFPNEVLWQAWLRNSSFSDNIKIWFHAKYPKKVKSDWVRSNLCKSFQLSPEWGSVDLTRTMVGLLAEVSS